MELIDGLGKLKALVNTSLAYTKDVYDQERLEEMQTILRELVTTYSTNLTKTEIERYFTSDVGYVTPKVDIRAVVFNDQNELLLVQEKSDDTWALPGGWGDVGYSPGEIAQKETWEEAGITVAAKQLIKVVDKAKQDYPPSLEYVYKFFIFCEIVSGELKPGLETKDVGFFSEAESQQLTLSLPRNSPGDVQELFAFIHEPWFRTSFD